MDCKNHAGRNGVNTCSKCGEWLCEDCSIEIEGRIICKKCVSRFIDGNDRPTLPSPSPVPSPASRPRPEGRRVISWGLLFIFSFILPGINYMYMGLIKRGLFAMSSFFLLIYVAANTGVWLLWLLIPVLWITSIFDGFEIRRKIMEGRAVDDNVTDIINSLYRYRVPILVVFVMLMGSSFRFRWMTGWNHMGMSYDAGFFDLIAFVVITFGVYFLFKAFAKSKKSDVVDKRNDNE